MKALLFVVLLWSAGLFGINNDYAGNKDYPVTVLQTYSGMSDGRHSSLSFVGVFQTDSGYRFDRKLSATDYYDLKAGDKTVMSIADSDIHPDTAKTFLYIGLPVLFIAAALACTIFLPFLWVMF